MSIPIAAIRAAKVLRGLNGDFIARLRRNMLLFKTLLVPFFCDIFVGSPVVWTGDREHVIDALQEQMQRMTDEGHFSAWE